MTLAQSIAHVRTLLAGHTQAPVDENALTTVGLRCTDSAYADALVVSVLADATAALAAVEADAAYATLAAPTKTLINTAQATIALCVRTAGGV
jgi:putative heme iron utilization protein